MDMQYTVQQPMLPKRDSEPNSGLFFLVPLRGQLWGARSLARGGSVVAGGRSYAPVAARRKKTPACNDQSKQSATAIIPQTLLRPQLGAVFFLWPLRGQLWGARALARGGSVAVGGRYGGARKTLERGAGGARKKTET